MQRGVVSYIVSRARGRGPAPPPPLPPQISCAVVRVIPKKDETSTGDRNKILVRSHPYTRAARAGARGLARSHMATQRPQKTRSPAVNDRVKEDVRRARSAGARCASRLLRPVPPRAARRALAPLDGDLCFTRHAVVPSRSAPARERAAGVQGAHLVTSLRARSPPPRCPVVSRRVHALLDLLRPIGVALQTRHEPVRNMAAPACSQLASVPEQGSRSSPSCTSRSGSR